MMDSEVFLTPKRTKRSIIPEGNPWRRKSLFEPDLEDEITPLSPTSSEIEFSPVSNIGGALTPLLKRTEMVELGVSELNHDKDGIPVKSFYGLPSNSPILNSKGLLDRVKKSLPESYNRIKQRLSFDDELPRKKRSRSAGNGDSAKRLKKKPKLQHYIPFEMGETKKKRKSDERMESVKEAKTEHKVINKKVKYNWEIFGTPKYFSKAFVLTPPSSHKKKKKKKKPLLRKFFINNSSSEEEESENEEPETEDEEHEKTVEVQKPPIVQELKELMKEMATEDENDTEVKNEVDQLLKTLENDDFEEENNENIDENIQKIVTPTKPKLFSIFVTPKSHAPSTPITPLSTRVHRMGLGEDQLQLDVGQNALREVECPTCRLLYCRGLPEDEIHHEKHHSKEAVFSFKGWKDERIVGYDGGNRIICVKECDKKTNWHRALEVIHHVDQELGFPEGGRDPDQIYFYIKDRHIVGVVGCINQRTAHRVLESGLEPGSSDICTEQSFPTRCGISRIWVKESCRRQGIAKEMLDAIRRNFTFGMFLTIDDLAFSSPTIDGKHLAEKYCKRKDYLVYL